MADFEPNLILDEYAFLTELELGGWSKFSRGFRARDGQGNYYILELIPKKRRGMDLLLGLRQKTVLNCFDIKQADNGSWIQIFEYFPGQTLRDLIDGGEEFSLLDIAIICIQICNGLTSIHELKLIHEDLRPENILINSQGELKIKGILIPEVMVNYSNIPEIWNYVAPEQVSKSVWVTPGASANAYSLASILYELLTKHKYGKSIKEIHEGIKGAKDPLLSLRSQLEGFPRPGLIPDIPQEFSAIILNSLHIDSDTRLDIKGINDILTSFINKSLSDVQGEEEASIEETPEDVREEESSIEETPEDFREEESSIEETPEDVREEESSIEETPEDFREEESSIEETPEDFREEESSIEETPEDFREEESSIEETPEDFREEESSIEEATEEDFREEESSIEETPEDFREEESSIEETPEDFREEESSIEETPEDFREEESSIEEAPEDFREEEGKTSNEPVPSEVESFSYITSEGKMGHMPEENTGFVSEQNLPDDSLLKEFIPSISRDFFSGTYEKDAGDKETVMYVPGEERSFQMPSKDISAISHVVDYIEQRIESDNIKQISSKLDYVTQELKDFKNNTSHIINGLKKIVDKGEDSFKDTLIANETVRMQNSLSHLFSLLDVLADRSFYAEWPSTKGLIESSIEQNMSRTLTENTIITLMTVNNSLEKALGLFSDFQLKLEEKQKRNLMEENIKERFLENLYMLLKQQYQIEGLNIKNVKDLEKVLDDKSEFFKAIDSLRIFNCLLKK
jgi:serine/threonine protein kinase